MTTDRKRGYLYILLAAMLYSTTEVALKALGGAFAPMQVTVERVLLGAAALMPFALNDLKKRDIQLTKADWGYFTLLGFLTVTLHMSLLQMAVLHMDASATSIIYSGNPVFAVALAHFILHEPLKKNHLLAIGVELVGILFILNPAHLEISLARLFGDHHRHAAVCHLRYALQAASAAARRARDHDVQHAHRRSGASFPAAAR